jgi:hypothetical protein
MEGALSFLDCSIHTSSHDVQIRIVGQFEVVNACHDAWEIVIGSVGRLAGFADHGEHGCETLEA